MDTVKGKRTEIVDNGPDEFDVVIIGAGVVGMCLARDLASIGYCVAVLERNSCVGGIWNTNEYPGLQLHGPGSCYRCLSLAPSWTRDHAASQWQRPYRQEIIDYVHAMSNHPKITVKTGRSYVRHYRNQSKLIVECEKGARYTARALVFSTGFSMNTCGNPIFPLDSSRVDPQSRPLIVHSSQLDAKTFEQARQSKRLFVVGSGKAAIEILMQLDPRADIVWAHRGHTAFMERKTIQQQFDSDGVEIAKQITTLSKRSMQTGEHWTELAIQQGLLIVCGFPWTSQRCKWGTGIVDADDLERAKQYRQIFMDSLKVKNGVIHMVSQTGDRIILNSSDCVVACTGQQNGHWTVPTFEEKGVFHVTTTSAYAPLCSVLPLCLTLDYLQGDHRRIALVRSQMSLVKKHMATDFCGVETREFQIEYTFIMLALLSRLFSKLKADICFRHEWNSTWYGKDLDVQQFLHDLL